MESGHHIISLDLGFAGEPTALGVVKPRTEYWHRNPLGRELEHANHFDVVHLERFQASVGYPQVVHRLKAMVSDRKRIPDCTVLVNTSSSGPAPLKLFVERNLLHYPFTVINSAVESWRGQTEAVPKRTIIGVTITLLQADRLRISSGLDLGKALFDEMANFRMRAPPADTIEAMRENPDDDLVFAVALACWWGDRLTWNEEIAEDMLEPEDDEMWAEHGRDGTTGY